MRKPDFSGWATKNDVLCSDGTVIRDGCFTQQDGEKVPLVWMHNHSDVGQVLGHAILHAVPGEGMRVDGYFNDTDAGKQAKGMLKNEDVDALSIWANHLERGKNKRDILHGLIKEVSLVIGGADPEARIDPVLSHGELVEDEAEIWGFGAPTYISHEDDKEDEEDKEDMKDDTTKKTPDAEDSGEEGETVKDVFNTLTDKQKKAVAIVVSQIVAQQKSGGSGDDAESDVEDDESKKAAPEKKEEDDEDVKHADSDKKEEESKEDDSAEDDADDADEDDSKAKDGETVRDVYNTLNAKQKKVVDFLVAKAVEDAKKKDSDKEETEVKHNVFEDYGAARGESQSYISHDDMVELTKAARSNGGSMKEAFHALEEDGSLAHADLEAGKDYGIKDVDYLFPDAKAINPQPDFIKRNTDWVDGVLSDVHRTPFSRVKSIHANITEDDARAKGYIKGKLKKEEVFSLLKRSTYPQTIYKKQRLDKDDIDDITDFDVVAWLKTEMQLMLREEIARAILIGDGRLASDDDHIKEENIRPVYNDSDLYTIKFPVEVPANATDDQKAKALLKATLKARKLYKGSGNMTFYTKEDELTNALLLENGIGERMYKSEAEVATAMRMKTIQPVEDMDGLQIEIADATGNTKTKYDVAGIAVNLVDYNVGTNGGAKTDFFSDFDINYNQQICLYETRLSGAMVKPFAAITFYYKTPAAGDASAEG